jgi:hypothetical protein
MKKKIFSMLMVLCIICTNGFVLISASALSNDISISDVGSGNAVINSSNDIDKITYSVSSSSYSADILFRGLRSGSVYMELQRWNGSNWSFVDSRSWTFNNVFDTYGSKSFSITQSGTYRISLVITISGVQTPRQSGNFII